MGVGTFVGEVELQLTTWQLEEGWFPAAVLEGVVGIIDEDLVGPCLAARGASPETYAEASVFGIGSGGTRIVGYEDGAVGKLNEVGHAVGGVVGVGGDEPRLCPALALIAGKAYFDASALAACHQATVGELDESSVAASIEDGDWNSGIPVNAAAVVAGYGSGVDAQE